MKKQINNTLYETTDLSLATVLSLLSFNLDDIKVLKGNRCIFIFESNLHLRNVVKKYWQKKLKVEPGTFFSELKLVKTRIYQR